jgi:protoporphyrinogen oxidase
LAAAYRLAQAGVPVELFEASGEAGGMARTFELWGQRVDVGPHRFFSNDRRVNELWLEVVGREYRMIKRLTRIYYGGRFFSYPLEPVNALSNLGTLEAARCIASYGLSRVRPAAADGTFETFVSNQFGRRLFETFFKSYSEKLWGISCRELDVDFAAQRIKKLSLWEAVVNAFQSRTGKTKHRTLADEFAYPKLGTGMVYNRMAEKVRELGGQVRFNAPVEAVLQEGDRVVGLRLAGGEEKRFDHVISSMPLTLLVSRLPGVPEPVKAATQALTFRNTILVYLQVAGRDLFPDNWLYVQSPELKTGRITNFRNWAPELNQGKEETILALEYWANDGDPIWISSDDALIELGKTELTATGLSKGYEIKAGKVLRVPRCYPVYRTGYKGHLTRVEDFLRGLKGLTPIGRYGSFKYNNQDHSLLMGMLAAENLTHDKGNDLWRVNTDYDEYQESTRITETGLAS